LISINDEFVRPETCRTPVLSSTKQSAVLANLLINCLILLKKKKEAGTKLAFHCRSYDESSIFPQEKSETNTA
jgi:hypothetical protein